MVAGPFISGFDAYLEVTVEQFHENLAFDLRNVDQSVLAGVHPGMLEVVRGRFDPEATGQALDACAECPQPVIAEHLGISFYSWGDDLAIDVTNILSPPAFDQFGRGGRIAVQEEYVFRTVETPGMQGLISASLGHRSSLAEAPDFQLLAGAMSDLSVHSVLFSDQTLGVEETLETLGEDYSTSEVMEELRQALEQSPLLRPYQALAMGGGKNGIGVYMALALVHGDDESAEANVDLLRQRIMETSSLYDSRPWRGRVDSMEIRAEGRVLLARLYGDMSRARPALFVQRDNLLIHE